MINLSHLPKIIKRPKKRLGQGIGSGKGKTAGRGTKGQKARGTIKVQIAQAGAYLIRRLPLYRGKHRNKPKKVKAYPVNVKYLANFPKGTVIDKERLIQSHIISGSMRDYPVKILGDGDLSVALIVKLPCSKGAAKKIEKAGGKVEFVKKTK